MSGAKNLLGFCLAGVLAICLLPASSHKAWGQCYCGGPGVICCDVPFVGHHCEAAITPTAKAMCPEEEEEKEPEAEEPPQQAQPPQRSQQPQQPQAQPKPQPPAQPKPQQEAQPKPQPKFSSQAPFQIQPLHCPRGFTQVGTTFYGGTRCAPAVQPRPAVVKPPGGLPRGSSAGTAPRGNEGVAQQPYPTAPGRPKLRWADNSSLDDVAAANAADFLAHRRAYVSLWERAAAVAVGAAIGGAIAGAPGEVVAGALVLYREWKAMKGDIW